MSRFDGLPLAIAIAAAFMRQTGTNPTQYLRYYENSWSELQSQSAPGRQYLQGNMLQTLKISYRDIQTRDPNAANLLLLLSRFNNRDIWFELIQGASNSSTVPEWLEGYLSSELAFKAGVKSLIQFSLLETKQQEGYSMHPVVQDWCFHVASEDNDFFNKLSELALICVGFSTPSKRGKENDELSWQRLIPHANSLHTVQLEVSGNDINVWEGFHGLGDIFVSQGRLQMAEEAYQRALTGKGRAFGPEHKSTLDAVNDLGIIFKEQGKLKQAEGMYQRVLEGRERALGPTHQSTLAIFNNLGILYINQERLKEAEESLLQALISSEKTLGSNNEFTLTVLNNTGLLYQEQGRLKEAEESFQRVRTDSEKTLGPNHPATLDTLNNLGILYRSQGRLEEAEEIRQRTLTGREKALGPNNLSTLDTVNNLGRVYSAQGMLKEAEEKYQRALEGYKTALGPAHKTHQPALNTLNNLGNLYCNQGRLGEAREMYEMALEGREKVFQPNHHSIWDTRDRLERLNISETDGWDTLEGDI